MLEKPIQLLDVIFNALNFRSRGYKRSKYEKRKVPSVSPVRHPSPLPIPHDRRGPSPYQDDRYLNSRPVSHDRLEPLPPKKKMRR